MVKETPVTEKTGECSLPTQPCRINNSRLALASRPLVVMEETREFHLDVVSLERAEVAGSLSDSYVFSPEYFMVVKNCEDTG